MPGNFEHLELRSEKFPAGRFFDQKIRFRRLNLQFETEVAKKFAVRNHRRSEWMTAYRTTKLPLNPGDILDVIDMSVCQKQKFKIDTEGLDPFARTFRCIEQDPPLWRLNQVTIRVKNAAAKRFIGHGI